MLITGWLKRATCRLRTWADPDGGKPCGTSITIRRGSTPVGINCLYINLKGREKHGIVPKEESRRLMEEVAAELEQLRDEDGNKGGREECTSPSTNIPTPIPTSPRI